MSTGIQEHGWTCRALDDTAFVVRVVVTWLLLGR